MEWYAWLGVWGAIIGICAVGGILLVIVMGRGL